MWKLGLKGLMGGGKTSIHLAMFSIFARMMGKDSYFWDVSQHAGTAQQVFEWGG